MTFTTPSFGVAFRLWLCLVKSNSALPQTVGPLRTTLTSKITGAWRIGWSRPGSWLRRTPCVRWLWTTWRTAAPSSTAPFQRGCMCCRPEKSSTRWDVTFRRLLSHVIAWVKPVSYTGVCRICRLTECEREPRHKSLICYASVCQMFFFLQLHCFIPQGGMGPWGYKPQEVRSFLEKIK